MNLNYKAIFIQFFNSLRISNIQKDIVLVIIFSFFVQLFSFIIPLFDLTNHNLGLADYYLLSSVNQSVLLTFFIMIFPLFISSISNNYYGLYMEIGNNIYIRTEKQKFIISDIIILCLKNFFLTILFFLMCFYFCGIFYIASGSSINLITTVSIQTIENMISPIMYINSPVIYYFIYILLHSLMAVTYTLIGYACSLLCKNKYIINIMPWIVAIVLAFILDMIMPSESIIVSHLNFLNIVPRTDTFSILSFISISLYIVIPIIIISKKIKKDIYT